ncbi:MAG: AraC family transcriptional regulator [Bacteroidota bacterium]
MIYQEFECDPALSSFILCYWKFEVPSKKDAPPSFQHFIVPDGCPSLVFFVHTKAGYRGSSLFGPTKHISEREVFRGSKTIGIRFRPGLITSICGLNGIDLRDQNIRPAPPIGDLELPAIYANIEDDTNLISELNRQFLASDLRPESRDAAVIQAAEAIMASKGNLSISHLITQLPKSERQLQKIFKREIGLSMKEFAIAMRIRASVIDLEYHKTDYQDAVFDMGYFDQAHFIRDFSNISSISLPDFKRYIRNIQHIGLAHRQ